MESAKIAITIDRGVLKRLDRMVSEKKYPNRSRAINDAVRARLDRIDRIRLATESAKLSPKFEREMAEDGLAGDFREWPEY